jgi:hypothetical protein
MPKVGDLVIFGECDAPAAHCIGRITHKDGATWYGSYLSKRTKANYSGDLCDSMVTPVASFGVRVTIKGKSLLVEKVGTSTATYSDHKKRNWQEVLPRTIQTA